MLDKKYKADLFGTCFEQIAMSVKIELLQHSQMWCNKNQNVRNDVQLRKAD